MKLLVFILLIIPFGICAQSIFPLGSPTQGQQARFGFVLDTCLKVPIKDTLWPSVYTTVTPEACLIYRRTDSSYYYNNGLNWNNKLLTLREADSLFLTSVPPQSFSSLTGKPSTLAGYGISDAYPLSGNPSGFITSNQNITLSGDVSGSGTTAITTTLSNTGVSAGSYDRVTVDAKGRVTAGVNMSVPTAIAAGARNFNQAYQVSSTLQSRIQVSSSISCNLSLSGGQSGVVTLEISANGSTGWIYIGEIPASNTGTLTIGLNTTQISGGQLTADLPAGYYWRLTTSNVVGTPTYTFRGGSYITY